MDDHEESLLSSTPAEGKRSKDQTWVQCDRCTKWRRIPQVMADSLDENAHWCGPVLTKFGCFLNSYICLQLGTCPCVPPFK